MADELPPVVVVGGFLTKNSQSYWGDVEQFFNSDGNRRKVIIAPVGACSSVHDRACEIFYSLKGGRIDYGAEHAQTHKHGRYGRKYPKGLYPEWSIEHPVHFVTHSLGGPTVIKLISLLRSNFFGNEYHPDMVRSMFAVAAPFKGTPIVYLLGASYNSDQHTLRPFSVGNFISKYIHISSFLGPLLPHNPEAWDFQPDSRNLGIFSLPHRPAADDEEEPSQPKRTWSALKRSVGTLLSNLRQSEWADTSDTGSHDSGFHAADAREKAGENELNPGTFYCSLTGSITTKHSGSHHHRPHRSFRSDIFMYIMAKMLGSFSYNLSPIPDFLFEKPAPTPITILSTPEPGRLKRPHQRRTLTTTSSFAPIDEEDDSLADMADLQSMGLHRRVASYESAVSASSMSGSSGWNSSTRSSYESVRPVSVCSLTPTSESSDSGPSSPSFLVPPHARRHSRRWSSTDWYAQWAEKWSEIEASNGEAIPSAYDETATTPAAGKKEKEDGKKLRQDLWENDGVVPCFSQHHPSECSINHCQHHGTLDLSDDPSSTACNNLRIGSFMKGVWHVFKSDEMPHDSFVGGLARYESQRVNLWKKISDSMQELDQSLPPTSPTYDSPHDDNSDSSFQFKTPVDDSGFLETTICDTTFMVTPPSPVVERAGHY